MSLKIYTDVVVVPSRLLALVRLLLEEGALPREEILGKLQARKDQSMAASTLLAAVELGIVTERSKLFDLASTIRPQFENRKSVGDKLPVVLAPLALAPTVGTRSNGFAQICAWFLLLGHVELRLKKHELLVRLEQDGLSLDELQARNAAVWDNIVYWARYLGLIYQYGAAMAENVVPDPTRFLERHLDDLIPAGRRVTSDDFIRRLGRSCPILDGGEVRRSIAEKTARDISKRTLSEGLSIALRRLEGAGTLHLESVDDADDFHLLADEKRITHLERRR